MRIFSLFSFLDIKFIIVSRHWECTVLTLAARMYSFVRRDCKGRGTATLESSTYLRGMGGRETAWLAG